MDASRHLRPSRRAIIAPALYHPRPRRHRDQSNTHPVRRATYERDTHNFSMLCAMKKVISCVSKVVVQGTRGRVRRLHRLQDTFHTH